MKYDGNLEITTENQDQFKDLIEVNGYVRVYGSAKLEAPNLQSVGGYVRVDGSAKLEALQSVGGDVRAYGSAKLEAPNLKKEKLTQHEINKLRTEPKKLNQQHFERQGYLFADSILQKIISKKIINNLVVYKTKKIAKEQINYVVFDGTNYSHGETIEKAIEDLRFKISDRDTSKYNHWKQDKDKEMDISEAIQGYRVITGACEIGTKDFVNSLNEVPTKISPSGILKITSGKYGNETLAEFLK